MMTSIPLVYQTARRTKLQLAGILVVLLPLSFAVSDVMRSTGSGQNYLIRETDMLPWERPTIHQRMRDHLKAARFLTQLNFYQEGHGLVLPPSITMDRIESAFGVEQFARTAGLVFEDDKLYGITEEKLGATNLLVSGCAACHMGKAAGIVVPGLGNKTADLFGLAAATEEDISAIIQFDSNHRGDDPEWQRANAVGLPAFDNLVEHSEYDSGTAGSINLFFAVEMAFKKAGLPPLRKPLFAPSKAPSLWGYGPKRKVGVFSDALLKGSPAGGAGLPLFIGNYSMEVFEQNMETYEAAEQQFEKLLPPEYPFEIDRSLMARGEAIFASECVHCHGEHHRHQDGLPLFLEPVLIDLEEVGTDPVRATVYDEESRERFASSPFAPFLYETGNDAGYLAPNLWGLWARFPYLHNGSVANLQDLLTRPEDRPTYIDLVDIGERHRFDTQRLGATPTDQAAAAKRAKQQDRWIFNSNRYGFSNTGHAFGTDLSQSDKRALIEYLKSL